MNLQRWSLLFVLLVGMLPVGCGQVKPQKGTIEAVAPEAKALLDAFMAKVAQNDVNGAFALLDSKATWPQGKEDVQNIARLTVEELDKRKARYGEPIGVEFIQQNMVGESLTEFVYLEKFERHAIRWMFVFYKPETEWVFNNLTWDDKVRLLFPTNYDDK